MSPTDVFGNFKGSKTMGKCAWGFANRNIDSSHGIGGEAAERPVHIQEVLATLYHNVGIDVVKAQLSDLNGRPQYLTDAGRGPIKELI